jgi:hypothetical protein
MNMKPGDRPKNNDLHSEIEALRREVAELRASRLTAATPRSAEAPPSVGEHMAMTEELKAVMEELSESIETGITKRPVVYVLGALLVGILVGRMLSR